MKKVSTPLKSHLPKKKQLEDKKLAELMDSPGRIELELRERLLNKNTIKAARIIAEEFVKRFGEISGTVKDVRKELLPKGRATEWEGLDLNISLFCKKFYSVFGILAWHPDNLGKAIEIRLRHSDKVVDFFDRVRNVLYSLPQKKDYKHRAAEIKFTEVPGWTLPKKKDFEENRKGEYRTDCDIARHFVSCEHCWRSVARKPFEKQTKLCHIHAIDSWKPEFRSRSRLEPKMREIRYKLQEIMPTFAWVRANTKIHPRDFWASMCISSNGFFPYLVRYLVSLKMPLNTPEDIVRAMEHPIDFNSISDLEKKAWEFHFNELGAYFELYYDRLLRAEAWLQAEAENKHGGKREKGKGEGEK